MGFWLFIIFSLFIQEPASTDATIFLVRENHINLVLVHTIWLFATLLDISIGYALGKWIQKKSQNTKMGIWAKKWSERIEYVIGKKGEYFAIILVSIINFPYLNAFILSWLNIKFRKLLILIFIGDSIYWIIEWIINISVRNNIQNSHTVLYVVVGLGLILLIVSKILLNKIFRKGLKNDLCQEIEEKK